jgi:hypothetical protein
MIAVPLRQRLAGPAPTGSLGYRREPEFGPELGGWPVAPAGKDHTTELRVTGAQLVDESPCDSEASIALSDAEVHDLDYVGWKVIEDVATHAAAVDSGEECPALGSVDEASVREEAEPSAVGAPELSNLRQLVAVAQNLCDDISHGGHPQHPNKWRDPPSPAA